MSTDQVHLERRAAQRFGIHLPIFLRVPGSECEACGFSQDLSARGVLLYTDLPLSVGDAVELTLVMPSEITLGENMRVRCPGRVMRVLQPVAGNKFGLAVYLESYEYLPAAELVEASASFARISALHEAVHQHEDEVHAQLHARSAGVP